MSQRSLCQKSQRQQKLNQVNYFSLSVINYFSHLIHFFYILLSFPERKELKDKTNREMLAAWKTSLVVGSLCVRVSISLLMLFLRRQDPTSRPPGSALSAWTSHCPADISTARKVKCSCALWLTLTKLKERHIFKCLMLKVHVCLI